MDLGSFDISVFSQLQPSHLSVKNSLQWIESDVSSPSFEQNKLLPAQRRLNFLISHRTFRTRSSPSVGLGSDPGKFGEILSSENNKKINFSLGKQSSGNELKELLTNSSPEEQTKVRVSKSISFVV